MLRFFRTHIFYQTRQKKHTLCDVSNYIMIFSSVAVFSFEKETYQMLGGTRVFQQ